MHRRADRSNIPQQALVLLNDPTYVEAARAFAARVLREGAGRPEDRLEPGLAAGALSATRGPTRPRPSASCSTSTWPSTGRTRPPPRRLLTTGVAPAPDGLDAAELAAWTNVARVLLNLHETITR